jgi:hypothetical protein
MLALKAHMHVLSGSSLVHCKPSRESMLSTLLKILFYLQTLCTETRMEATLDPFIRLKILIHVLGRFRFLRKARQIMPCRWTPSKSWTGTRAT